MKELRKIPKPVRIAAARCSGAERYNRVMLSQRFVFGRFVFDASRSTVFRDGVPVAIGHRGLAILHALLRAHGRIVTKSELLDAAWPGAVVEESNLTVQIAALRKFLGGAADDTEWIVTVPRVGYRFAAKLTMEDGL